MGWVYVECICIYSKRGRVRSFNYYTASAAELFVGCIAEPDNLVDFKMLNNLTDKNSVNTVKS